MITLGDVDNRNEEWRPVVGAEGLYEVSSLGRVRSLARNTPRKARFVPYTDRVPHAKRADTMLIREKVLNATICDGYPRVSLRVDGRTLYRMVHRLVALAFLGPVPNGCEVRHKSGDRGDASLSNLEYGTRAENIADAKRHGTFCGEERRSQAKLTAELAAAIAVSEGSLSEIGIRFSISPSVVRQIKTGQTWKSATEGHRRPYSARKRLTHQTVLEIYVSTDRAVDAAARFGVSVDTVYSIRSGRLHAQVTGHKRDDAET